MNFSKTTDTLTYLEETPYATRMPLVMEGQTPAKSADPLHFMEYEYMYLACILSPTTKKVKTKPSSFLVFDE